MRRTDGMYTCATHTRFRVRTFASREYLAFFFIAICTINIAKFTILQVQFSEFCSLKKNTIIFAYNFMKLYISEQFLNFNIKITSLFLSFSKMFNIIRTEQIFKLYLHVVQI